MKKSIGILAGIGGILAGGGLVGRLDRVKLDGTQKKLNKYYGYFYIFDNWMKLKEQGKTTEKFFTDNQYKTIAIYGMGIMGKHLCEDLKNTGIHIAYAIDRNENMVYGGVELRSPEDELPQVDAIVVSATFDFNNIADMLREKVPCKIISLEDVVAQSL